MRRKLWELKHLSTRRKRKRESIPPVAASEKGGAQTDLRVGVIGQRDEELKIAEVVGKLHRRR